MKERPILFSGEMVRAILEGRKTQTRRVIKNLDKYDHIRDCAFCCPFGIPGDRLWARETFVLENTIEYGIDPEQLPTDRPHRTESDGEGDVYHLIPHYRATEPEPHIVPFDLEDGDDDRTRWKPSIFMPRWASRITLEITRIRVERVQEITGANLLAEGIQEGDGGFNAFKNLWDSLNAKRGYGWDVNSWVWVVEFKRVEK